MKVSRSKSVLLALGLASGAVWPVYAGEGYRSPSLLPMPSMEANPSYGVQQTAAFRRFEAEEARPLPGASQPMLTSADGQAPLPAPQLAEPASPYEAARGGAWVDDTYGYSDGSCESGDCAGFGECYVPCQPCTCWWAGANFLYMGRDREDFQQLSFDDTDLVGSVLNTDSADMNWSPGFEVSLGRWFCGGAWGIEAKYWGIFADNQEETVLASNMPGNLNTVFDFQPLNIGATNVNGLYDAAQAHRVRRDWQFHNVELNWLQGYGYSGRALNVGLIGGVRYFRFDEGFQYASADQNPVFGADPANEAYYDIDVENHLIGLQMGANASYDVTSRFRLRATPKIGVFNNHISQSQRIYNINGVAVVGPGNPLAGQAYDINTSKDDVSFLAEIDLGFDYRISRHWSLNAGYRAVALTGVAFATTQIPRNFADIPGAEDIDNDESLILHGGYLGATFAW